MEILKTIKIKSDSAVGYAFINEDDFDPSIHELFDAPKVEPATVSVPKRGRKPASEQVSDG